MKQELAIKDAIKRNGLSVTEVAERMGITRFTLSTHINGNPSAEILLRIADAIGCPVAELFTSDPNGQPGGLTCPVCKTRLKLVPDEE